MALLGWGYGKSAAECNLHMLESEQGADVCFEFEGSQGAPQSNQPLEGVSGASLGCHPSEGSSILVRAHRCMLACRSSALEQLMSAKRTEAGHVHISDVLPDIFRMVLRYIYADEVDVPAESARALMLAANKYQLPGLVRKCLAVLHDGLTVQNVCTMLNASLSLNDAQLKERCLKFICANVEAVVGTEWFLDLSCKAVEIVVKRDEFEFSSRDEGDVHAACVKWAKAQLQQQKVPTPTGQQVRDVLGSVLYKIRYPIMKAADFTSCAGKVGGLLTASEMSAVYSYIATKQHNASLAFDCSARENSNRDLTPMLMNLPSAPLTGHGRLVKNTSGHVPPLSSNATNRSGFVASSSSEYSSAFAAHYAFNGMTNAGPSGTEWANAGVKENFWLKIKCPTPVAIWKVALRGRAAYTTDGIITDWRLEGSNDDANFVPLFASTVKLDAVTKEFLLPLDPTPTAFAFFRLFIVNSTCTRQGYPGVSYFQIFALNEVI